MRAPATALLLALGARQSSRAVSDVARPPPPPPPAAPDASGAWRTPRGAHVTTVRVGLSRLAEVDGVPFTAYHAADEGQYWVHEGGGLSGTDRWFGPFPLR